MCRSQFRSRVCNDSSPHRKISDGVSREEDDPALDYFGWWIALLSLAMLGRCGCAQEKPDSPEPKTTQTAQSPKTGTKDKDQEANDEVPKRILWIIPNFMTANDQPQNLGPLTPKQKFNIAWHSGGMSAHILGIFCKPAFRRPPMAFRRTAKAGARLANDTPPRRAINSRAPC